MSILIPVILGGLAGLAASEARPGPVHPAAVYAQEMTAAYAEAGGPVTLSYTYDEATATLRVTGQLSRVIPSRMIRLVAHTLQESFVRIAAPSLDLQALAEMGVSVDYALLDRNRTPVAAPLRR
ncbi:MAG: hypothetical protein WBG08_02675 [Litorimonas sp.]